MPLLNRNSIPHGGFPYREPSINWPPPGKLPYDVNQPFNIVAGFIQQVRLNNPGAGLDPSFEACCDALDAYTCTRLRNDPRFCSGDRAAVAAAAATVRKPVPCTSCGHRRKAA